MTVPAEQRVCVRLNCRLRGQVTTAERCPACEFRTQESYNLRPDPTPEERAAETAASAALNHKGRRRVLVVTTNDIPGYRVTEVHGDVYGLTVRARDYFSNIGARFRTVVGGEVGGYTRLLGEAREEARQRLMDEAQRLGANAVLAMRFDCNEIGGIMNEIASYGTAVTVQKLDDEAQAR